MNREGEFKLNETASDIVSMYFQGRLISHIDSLTSAFDGHVNGQEYGRKVIVRDLYRAFNYPRSEFEKFIEEEYLVVEDLDEGQENFLKTLSSISRICNGIFNENPGGMFYQVATVSIAQSADKEPLRKHLGDLMSNKLNGYLEAKYPELYRLRRVKELRLSQESGQAIELEMTSRSSSLVMTYSPSSSVSNAEGKNLIGPADRQAGN